MLLLFLRCRSQKCSQRKPLQRINPQTPYKKGPPIKQYKNAALLFVLMGVSYAVLTANTIAIANHNRLALGVTDVLISTLNFTILKKLIDAESTVEMIGYALGGATGAQIALCFYF